MKAVLTASITTKIVESYIDFDGVQVDVVEMRYPNGKTETRSCWTEENLDGEITGYYVITRSGTILCSEWKTTKTNKWILTYQELWLQRHATETAVVIDEQEQEEIEFMRAAQIAKADLGFGW